LGWAAKYAEATARMIEFDEPQDFVIATGQVSTLEEFVSRSFSYFGLDWRAHVEIDPNLKRPADISMSVGDPNKAERLLGWRATTTMPALVDRLLDAEMERRQDGRRDNNAASAKSVRIDKA
jgi:GDPmannose 4,6-dehydratase